MPPSYAIDRPEVARAVACLFAPDDVFEVRALRVPVVGKVEPYLATFVSWMKGRAADLVPDAIRNAAGAAGIFVTPQQLEPTLTRRRSGSLEQVRYRDGVAQTPPTAADDVTARRYLLVDVDPERADGFGDASATDGEKAAALEVAGAVRGYLAAKGWPAPLVVDSGNGYHLYYRLAEAQPGGLVDSNTDPLARLLRGLARKFDTPGATIDPVMYTPARIMKLPGTWSRKGDHTAARPHRPCRILEQPDDWAPGLDTTARADRVPLADLLAELPGAAARAPAPVPPSPPRNKPADRLSVPERARRYLEAYREKRPAIDGQGGHNATFVAAQAMVNGFGLDQADAYTLLMAVYNVEPYCHPPWRPREIMHKVEQALAHPNDKPRYWLRDAERPGASRTDAGGSAAPAGQVVTGARTPVASSAPSPSEPAPELPDAPPASAPAPAANEADDDPHRLARAVLAGYRNQGLRTLGLWRDEYHEWDGCRYTKAPEREFKAKTTATVHKELMAHHRARLAAYDPAADADPPKMPKVTRPLIGNVVGCIESMCLIPGTLVAPGWLPGATGPDPRELVASRGGLVHLPAYAAGDPAAVRPNTPAFFNLNAVAFVPDPAAPEPTAWLAFLAQLWPDDGESVALLQEWFGYLLTPDTRQQKMLLLVGPPSAGKGSIMSILQHLVGDDNCVGPRLHTLGNQFGLEPFLGKTVAIIGDARLSARADATAVAETLLMISGEDAVTVDRKHVGSVTARLPLRFVFLTNELPKLPDPSGALARRWSLLRFIHTFRDKEDKSLRPRLLAELPGIFNWAVAGWKRLREQGRFTRPAASDDLLQDLNDAGNPVGEFVRERCEVGAGYVVSIQELYDEWKRWCESAGRKEPGTMNRFGIDLRAIAPKLTKSKAGPKRERFNVYRGIRLTGDPSLTDESPATVDREFRVGVDEL